MVEALRIGQMRVQAASFAILGAIALALLLAGDTGKPAGQQIAPAALRPAWAEVKWPFPLDQWGLGRAFTCLAGDCGAQIDLYLRPKLGFCNCATGVSDDAELDRVGDLELLSAAFQSLSDGQPVAVGWMSGRSRPYEVAMRYGAARTALAIAFNDKCDVVVATVVTERNHIAEAQRMAVAFLNSDSVLRWVEKELGL